MQKIGLWWTFLLVFALMIAGLFSLGCWTRQSSAVPQVSQSNRDSFSTSATANQLICQPKHWRTLVMRQ